MSGSSTPWLLNRGAVARTPLAASAPCEPTRLCRGRSRVASGDIASARSREWRLELEIVARLTCSAQVAPNGRTTPCPTADLGVARNSRRTPRARPRSPDSARPHRGRDFSLARSAWRTIVRPDLAGFRGSPQPGPKAGLSRSCLGDRRVHRTNHPIADLRRNTLTRCKRLGVARRHSRATRHRQFRGSFCGGLPRA